MLIRPALPATGEPTLHGRAASGLKKKGMGLPAVQAGIEWLRGVHVFFVVPVDPPASKMGMYPSLCFVITQPC